MKRHIPHRCFLFHMLWGSRMSMRRLPGKLLRLGDSPSPQSTRLRTRILLPARPRWFGGWKDTTSDRRHPQAIFIGGGNTFQLLDNLYKKLSNSDRKNSYRYRASQHDVHSTSLPGSPSRPSFTLGSSPPVNCGHNTTLPNLSMTMSSMAGRDARAWH